MNCVYMACPEEAAVIIIIQDVFFILSVLMVMFMDVNAITRSL